MQQSVLVSKNILRTTETTLDEEIDVESLIEDGIEDVNLRKVLVSAKCDQHLFV